MATKTRPPKILSFEVVDAFIRATTDGIEPATVRLSSWLVARRIGPLPGRPKEVSPRAVELWRLRGLDVWQADRIATALGMEPDDGRLWGRTWSDLVDQAVEDWIDATGEPWDPPALHEQGRLSV